MLKLSKSIKVFLGVYYANIKQESCWKDDLWRAAENQIHPGL